MSVDVKGVFKHYTDRAVLLEIDGEDRWIPRSVIEDGFDPSDENAKGDEVELQIKSWFAEREGLG